MPIVVELLGAGVVAIGLIALFRALATGFAMAGRRPHDSGTTSGSSATPLEAQLPPPGK